MKDSRSRENTKKVQSCETLISGPLLRKVDEKGICSSELRHPSPSHRLGSWREKKKLVSSNKGNRSSWGEGSSLALSWNTAVGRLTSTQVYKAGWQVAFQKSRRSFFFFFLVRRWRIHLIPLARNKKARPVPKDFLGPEERGPRALRSNMPFCISVFITCKLPAKRIIKPLLPGLISSPEPLQLCSASSPASTFLSHSLFLGQ